MFPKFGIILGAFVALFCTTAATAAEFKAKTGKARLFFTAIEPHGGEIGAPIAACPAQGHKADVCRTFVRHRALAAF